MGKNLVRLIFQKAAKIKALSIFFENEKMKKKENIVLMTLGMFQLARLTFQPHLT